MVTCCRMLTLIYSCKSFTLCKHVLQTTSFFSCLASVESSCLGLSSLSIFDQCHVLSSISSDLIVFTVRPLLLPEVLILSRYICMFVCMYTYIHACMHALTYDFSSHISFSESFFRPICLQCFDAVGLAAGRASGL